MFSLKDDVNGFPSTSDVYLMWWRETIILFGESGPLTLQSISSAYMTIVSEEFSSPLMSGGQAIYMRTHAVHCVPASFIPVDCGCRGLGFWTQNKLPVL
jgi:hypothetical protein